MKKSILFLSILLFISCCNTKTDAYSDIVSNRTGQSINLAEVIDSVDIECLSSEELRILRNEIFARHGYNFESSELQKHFFQYDWYTPTIQPSQINELLTKIDLNNIDLIKSIENSIKWESDIQRLLNLIPEIQLPLHFSCNNGFEITEIETDQELIIKYLPDQAHIVGKLYQDKKEAAIIYSVIGSINYPTILKIDNIGKELESIHIFDGELCDFVTEYRTSTTGIITEDYKIQTTLKLYKPIIENGITKIDTITNIKTISIKK